MMVQINSDIGRCQTSWHAASLMQLFIIRQKVLPALRYGRLCPPCPGTPLNPGARVGHLAIVEAGLGETKLGQARTLFGIDSCPVSRRRTKIEQCQNAAILVATLSIRRLIDPGISAQKWHGQRAPVDISHYSLVKHNFVA